MPAVHRPSGHREQAIEWLTEHLALGPTERLLGALVEAHDAEIIVKCDNGVSGDIYDCRERCVRMRVSHGMRIACWAGIFPASS